MSAAVCTYFLGEAESGPDFRLGRVEPCSKCWPTNKMWDTVCACVRYRCWCNRDISFVQSQPVLSQLIRMSGSAARDPVLSHQAGSLEHIYVLIPPQGEELVNFTKKSNKPERMSFRQRHVFVSIFFFVEVCRIIQRDKDNDHGCMILHLPPFHCMDSSACSLAFSLSLWCLSSLLSSHSLDKSQISIFRKCGTRDKKTVQPLIKPDPCSPHCTVITHKSHW